MPQNTTYGSTAPEDRTECVGTCMVCDPHCGVHRVRRQREQERLERANRHVAAFAGSDVPGAVRDRRRGV